MDDDGKMTLDRAEALLGIEAGAGAEELRAAYLAQVRLYPPDRDPERFERIRDAHQLLSDPRAKAGRLLEGESLAKPFTVFVDRRTASGLRFVGPEPWLAAIVEKRTRKG